MRLHRLDLARFRPARRPRWWPPLLVGAALLFSGCGITSFSLPIQSVVRPEERLDKSTPFALKDEPDLPLEARLTREQLVPFLQSKGFAVVPEAQADLVVRLAIPSLLPPTASGGLRQFSVRTVAYRAADVRQKRWNPIWEASTWVPDEDWRKYKFEILHALLARLGQTFDGTITVPSDPAARPPTPKG